MPVKEKLLEKNFNLIQEDFLFHILEQYNMYRWDIIPLIKKNKSILDINRQTETAKKLVIRHENKLYFIKEFPWYCSEQEYVDDQLKFQKFLHDENFKTPKIIETKDGKLFSKGKEHSNYFYIQEFINGNAWTKSKYEIKIIGQFLSDFHNLSEKYRAQKIGTAKEETVFELANSMLNLLENKYNTNKVILSSEHSDNLNKFLNTNRSLIKSIEESARKKGYGKKKIIVHGDFNPANLIFDKENKKIKSVIDFNNMCLDDASHDVAEAILHHTYINYKNKTTIYEKIPDIINEEWFLEFCKSYSNKKRLNEVKPYLAEVITCITIELSALGVICGDYKISDLKPLLYNNKKMLKEAKKLVDKI